MERVSNCAACKMIAAGVKSRKALPHTCDLGKPQGKVRFTSDGNVVLDNGLIAFDGLDSDEEARDLADAFNEADKFGPKFTDSWEGFFKWAKIMEHPILRRYDYA